MLHLEPEQLENIYHAAKIGAAIGGIALLGRIIFFQIFERDNPHD